MKHMTIWQRLHTALAVLVALLMLGVAAALWVEENRWSATHRSDQLSGAQDRIYLNLVRLNDAVRGLLLDPKSEFEKKRRHDAETSLPSGLDSMQHEFRDHPELITSLKTLRDFTVLTLGPFHKRVVEMAETNSAEAMTYYNQNFTDLRERREKYYADLTQQVENVRNAEATRAQWIFNVGVGCIVAILVASFFAGRFQSSIVTVPLNRVVATLERMRSGDFTERQTLNRHDEFGVLGDGLNRLADDLSGL